MPGLVDKVLSPRTAACETDTKFAALRDQVVQFYIQRMMRECTADWQRGGSGPAGTSLSLVDIATTRDLSGLPDQ